MKKSVEYFQKHYELAKSLPPKESDKQLVDSAKVSLAIALAGQNFDPFMDVLDTNLHALL